MTVAKKVTIIAASIFAAMAIGGNVKAQQSEVQQTQPGPGYRMGPSMMGGWGMRHWMGGDDQDAPMCTRMASNIDGRLAFLKTELKITEGQESLWTAYAKAARDNATNMAARCTTMMGENGPARLSLPDRLDLREQFMAAQLESLRTLNKALKPLYAALDDNQQKAANELIWGPMGMM